jgi:hypothetical protein
VKESHVCPRTADAEGMPKATSRIGICGFPWLSDGRIWRGKLRSRSRKLRLVRSKLANPKSAEE